MTSIELRNALKMAFWHDREVFRTKACGIAGLSVVADVPSAQ